MLQAPTSHNGSHPHLRAIDVRRVSHQGEPYFLLRDALGVVSQQLLVPLHYGGILALCDGTRSLDTLVEEARALYGSPIDLEEARDLLDTLDSAGMLEGGNYVALYSEAVKAWRAQSSRPLAHAGAGYPERAKALARYLNQYLDGASTVDEAQTPLDWGSGVAFLSPHIDYARGGSVYAQVWKSMGQAVREADVAVILATDHHGNDPFSLTTLSYATPYGVLPNDQPLFDALVETIGSERAFAGELRHAGEHSIELVVNWLHHVREGKPLPIVPVLTGSLHRYLHNGAAPATDPTITEVIALLRSEMQRRKVLIIASGDLAHVGPAFGGAPLYEPELVALRSADERLIAAMQSGDADAFFAEIKAVGDCNNVCGVVPIYLAMRAAQGVQGIPAGYAICPADEQNTSVVTIAGVRFAPTS